MKDQSRLNDETTKPLNSSEPEPGKNEKTWAMLCHLLGLTGFFIPFGQIIFPLVLWMMKRNESQFVNDQGRESLNFQITITIVALVSALLILVFIGYIITPVILLLYIIFIVDASSKASKGIKYRYAVCFRFLH